MWWNWWLAGQAEVRESGPMGQQVKAVHKLGCVAKAGLGGSKSPVGSK